MIIMEFMFSYVLAIFLLLIAILSVFFAFPGKHAPPSKVLLFFYLIV